jgi:hypothetical protein
MEKSRFFTSISAIGGLLLSAGFVSAQGTLTDILNRWAEFGIFSYFLPFLLIFAFVYGILLKSKILGENTGVNLIVSAALAGLALVGDTVPRFFQEIVPNIGMALIVLIAAVILLGLFYGESEGSLKWIKNVLFGIGAVALVVVLFSSFSSYNFSGSFLWEQYGPALIALLILGGAIALMVAPKKKKD